MKRPHPTKRNRKPVGIEIDLSVVVAIPPGVSRFGAGGVDGLLNRSVGFCVGHRARSGNCEARFRPSAKTEPGSGLCYVVSDSGRLIRGVSFLSSRYDYMYLCGPSQEHGPGDVKESRE